MLKYGICATLIVCGMTVMASDLMAASSSASTFGTSAPVATPEGITLQVMSGGGRRRGGGPPASAQASAEFPTVLPRLDTRQPADTDYYFADPKGLTLYFTKKDAEGRPTCVDECAKTWAPALAPRGAKPSAPWSTVTRADGATQWAYQNHPLYTNARDTKPGDANGNGAEEGAWQSVAFRPNTGFVLPAGFGVRVAKPLNGQVLTEQGGFTAYYFDGKQPSTLNQGCEVSTCGKRWLPVRAPGLAKNVGDFSVVSLAAGGNQWAYKGKPLFTYTEDLNTGDVHGEGVDKWRAVTMLRYPSPSDVKLGYDDIRGAYFTKGGMTLYRQDVSDHTSRSRSVPYTRIGRPAVGRAIGVATGCSDTCLKTWKPFVAPKNAQPSGFWEIVTREDTGERQWVYKGHALYTYANDKKSGDVNGDNVYETRQDDRLTALWRTGVDQGSMLYWAPMPP